jgi:hypothetical protein
MKNENPGIVHLYLLNVVLFCDKKANYLAKVLLVVVCLQIVIIALW